MAHFSYCFCLTLMHSLWQAALLLCVYLAFNAAVKRNDPIIKRNILFSLLFAQAFISISTFYIYYTGAVSFYTDQILPDLSGILTNQPLLEKLAPWLILLYSLVLLYRSARLIINWVHFKDHSKTAWIKPSIDLKLFTTLKSFEFGIRRKVSLWYSNSISTPMTFGFFKPVILLPVALLNNLSLEETETLIIHELTHIKNNDYFLNWLLVTCETIFFFNPFVKIIGNKIRLEREKNCDSHVLQFDYPAINYAETLLKAASFKTTPAPFFLAAAIKNTELFRRIQFFTEENNLRFHKRNYTAIAILPVLVVLVLNILLLNFMQQKERITPAVEPVIAATAAGLGSEDYIHGFSATAPLVKEVETLAKESSKLAAKEEIKARAIKELATLTELEIPSLNIEPANIAMPVSIVQAADTKEVTLKEESSATGRSVTKVYKMKFVNGEWKTTLLWTITERRPVNDSCLIITDTTHYYNPVQ